MNARTIITALVGIAIGAVVGILGFITFVGGDGEASEPISAPTLDINAVPTLNPTQAFDAVTQVAELNTEVEALQSVVDNLSLELTNVPQAIPATVIPTETPNTEVTEEPTEVASATRTLYRIDPEVSEVTFTLQEDLRENRIDVVGVTNEVAGDIIIDLNNPAASTVGVIRINARTLATDNFFRNRALRSQILLSAQDQYEFIEFTPTLLEGLPDTSTANETYEFQIVGDLPIIGVNNEVTFDATVTLGTNGQITGSATTTVLYADWNISIPSAPGVANITDEVTLRIDFVANEVEE